MFLKLIFFSGFIGIGELDGAREIRLLAIRRDHVELLRSSSTLYLNGPYRNILVFLVVVFSES